MDDHPHVWHGSSPRSTHCAVQGCIARPSPADVDRLAADVAQARAMRVDLGYSTPARRLAESAWKVTVGGPE
jgi:hypothetical protein